PHRLCEIGVERPVGENLCTEFHGSLTDFGRGIPERCLQGTTRRVRSNRILASIEIMRWDFGVRGMQHPSRCRIRSTPLVKAHRSARRKGPSACTRPKNETCERWLRVACRLRVTSVGFGALTTGLLIHPIADIRVDIDLRRLGPGADIAPTISSWP